jgi:hypothetical protein
MSLFDGILFPLAVAGAAHLYWYTQRPRRKRPADASAAPGPPRRLSLIGYWSVSEAPPEQSPGYPDPHYLVHEWTPRDRRAVVEYLGRGKLLRQFMGHSKCRFCGQLVGSREFTDGSFAWPEGLVHYVEAHAVRLPEAFLERVRSPDRSAAGFLRALEPEAWVEGDWESASPVELKPVRAWYPDVEEWLDWAAANTPARPNADAASLDEVRALSERLSHAQWRVKIEEAYGRWRLEVAFGEQRMYSYLQKCRVGIVERRLLRLRLADPERPLTPEQANAIASACDGPWGALRVVMAAEGGWLVWSKRPADVWPTLEELEPLAKQGLRFDQAVYTGSGKLSAIPTPDEPQWRWVITLERESRASREAGA